MVDALSASGPAEETRALLLLDRLPGVGLVTLRTLVRAFGSARAALAAPRSAFADVAGPAAARARHDGVLWRASNAAVDDGLALGARLDMTVVTWDDASYPARLHHLHDPPPVLFLRGRSELLAAPAVTIVGSRRSTGRARDVAARLGRALGEMGTCVVSGLALGIDGAAHRGALAAGGATLAVLGRGADAPYPPSHARLFRQIVAEGLVVSEFLPGTPALPHHFPRRNRILAALASTVVVVEAGAKSGALITVDHALDIGSDVWAVPGPIDVTACAGSNRMLADGARPLVSIPDFVREVAASDVTAWRPAVRAPSPAGALLAGLGHETLTVDELAGRVGLTAASALALLAELELEGAVHQLPGLRFRRAA